MAHGGGVHTTMNVAVDVGVGVDVRVGVAVSVGVDVAVKVGVKVLVLVAIAVKVGIGEGVSVRVVVRDGLAVGGLVRPAFLLLMEMIITPRRIARMAPDPIMVLDFMTISYGFGATNVPMAGASVSAAKRGKPFSIRTGTQS